MLESENLSFSRKPTYYQIQSDLGYAYQISKIFSKFKGKDLFVVCNTQSEISKLYDNLVFFV